MFNRTGAAALSAVATTVVAVAATGMKDSGDIARSESARQAGLHVWGTLAKNAGVFGEHLGGGCPREVAWGAGAGCVVTSAGDIVGLHAASASVKRFVGASACNVALDGDNNIFYTDTAGKLFRWAPFGATTAPAASAAELALPGRVMRVACGDAHCLAINDQGLAYSWATRKDGGRMGVLGRRTPPDGDAAEHLASDGAKLTPEDVPAPVALPAGSRAAECAAGDRHRCRCVEAYMDARCISVCVYVQRADRH